MSVVLEPRLSRWGCSVYETALDVGIEKEQLSELVSVVDDFSDAEILVVHSKQPIGKAEIQQAPSAQLVITTTSGWEHIDVGYLHSIGVKVVRMPLLRRDAVVESIFAMLLHINRRNEQFQIDASMNQWTRSQLPNYQPIRIQDQTVAVIGLGVIGTQLAKLLHGFGASIVGCDPKGIPLSLPFVSSVEWDEVPSRADVTLLACTHNSTSHEMVNDNWLKQCRSMILVNCARGKLVDYHSALAAIQSGHLGALGLDVFPKEPHLDMHAVKRMENVIFTPHAAGYHPYLSAQIRETLIQVVTVWLKGLPIPSEVLEA